MPPRKKQAPQRGKFQLQSNPLSLYRRVLLLLCQAHRSHEPARRITSILGKTKKLTKDKVEQLVTYADSLVAQKYATATEHFVANQFASLIRKYPFPSDVNPFTPEDTAYAKFLQSEQMCARTNKLFRLRRSAHRGPSKWESNLNQMRHFIAYAIGDAPDVDQILDNGGFGPGANVGVSGFSTHVGRKLTTVLTVTPGARSYGLRAIARHAQFLERFAQGHVQGEFSPLPSCTSQVHEDVQYVAYNKIVFVPKTAKISRSIAVEPLLNSYIQKGVDVVLRRNLKRLGLDLSDQERNSEMAREGSLGGDDPLCTIDLSSASDSISIELVRELLPPDWFAFLNAIRSKYYSYNGDIIRYNKFTSMGNGFCFPLETLIFLAAAHSCGAVHISADCRVYGDDIIVRSSVAPKLIRLLRYIGFRINREKTFLQGPFRESCGKDWFGGVDVRPYTLDIPLDSIQSMFKILNGTLRNDFCKSFFSSVRSFLIDRIPEEYRFFRPFSGPEDSGIDSIGDEYLTSAHVRWSRHKNGRGHGAWVWKEIVSTAVSDKDFARSSQGSAFALVYAALLGSSSKSPFTLRQKSKTKVRLISHPEATSQWLPPLVL